MRAQAEIVYLHLRPQWGALCGHLAQESSQEERNRVSSNWVRHHTSPHVVALTLETAWNRPEGTQQGYQRVGQQLGLTVARYLTTDPKDQE